MKKLFSVLLAVCMLFNTAAFALPTIDMVETGEEITILFTEEIVEEENAVASLKPGINVYKGNATGITFETEDDLKYVTVTPRWLSTATVDYGIDAQTSYNGIGNSLMFRNTNGVTDASGHFVTSVKFKADFTVDRPAFFIARVSDACTYWRADDLLRSNISGYWEKGTISMTYGTDAVLNSDTIALDVWSIYSNSYSMYIDNVALIPFYQITYKNILPDGTAGKDLIKYELDTSNIDVSSDDGAITGLPAAFVPSGYIDEPEGYTLIGWSTEENASEKMKTVPLSGEDITLYPVWTDGGADTSADVLKPGINAFTGDTKAVTFETEADLKYVSLAPAWDQSAVIDYQIGERTAYGGIGKSLMFRNTNGKPDASMHFVTRMTFTMPVAVDRPALLVARVCDAYTQWRGGRCNDELRTNTAGDWRNAVITKALDGENTLDSNTFVMDALSLDGNSHWMYFDNLAIIPYYRIVYKNILPDGSAGEDTVKYALDTSAVDVSNHDGTITGLPTELVPSESLEYEGYTLLGWSASENASGAEKTIPLFNEDITLYPVWREGEYTEPGSEAPVRLILADSEITVDGDSITMIPVLEMKSGNVLTDFTDLKVLYTIDNVHAIPFRNANGSLTLTGRMNGEVNIGVCVEYDGTEFTAEAKVNVSGQTDKCPANDIKLITYGNSIMNHGPNDALSWTGNWGMAASSKDKDYVHQLISLIEDKYGSGSVTHVFGDKHNGFESETNDATPDTDWTQKLDGLSAYIAGQKPDIITVQYGENSQQRDADVYEKAVTAFVDELRKGAPDAVILITTPYWSDPSMGTNKGARATAHKLGIPLADVASLTHIPGSMATGLYEHPGVAAHPSDYGMQLIAEEMFAKLNPYLTDAITQKYTDIPDSIVFTNKVNTITTELGTLALEVKVNPENAAQDVIYNSSDEDIATVDATGLVTARNNGVVTITAVSKYSNKVKGSIKITVSGQTTPFTITYNKNTEDKVTGMPENNTKAKYETVLSEKFPERETYKFLGWSTEKDGKTVDSLYVTENVTVYAIWEKAYRWTFEKDGYAEGIVIEDGFNQKVAGGRFMAMATGTDASSGNVLTVKSPRLDLDSAEYASLSLSIQNTVINSQTEILLKIITTDGVFEYSKKVASTNPAMYMFDLSDVTGTVTGFDIVPTNIDATIYVDEIFFNKKAVPGLNAFTGTDKAVTLENEADLSYFTVVPKWDKNAVVDYGIGERTAYGGIGKSLVFRNTNGVTDASGHFVTQITARLPAKVERPAVVLLRVCDACTQWSVHKGGFIRKNLASDWKNGVIRYETGEDNVLNSDILEIEAWSIYSNQYDMYLDNLVVVPYYKVTYKNILPDGNTGSDIVKYWLDTEKLDVSANDGIIAGLPESYIPDEALYADGFRIKGWTTDQGSNEVMASIKLNNNDIVLYPVWEEYIDFTMDISGKELVYIDGNTHQFSPVFSADIPEKRVIWSVSDQSVATIDENGVLTPVKSGEITVRCVSVYNYQIAAEKSVTVSYVDFDAEIVGADSIASEYRSQKYKCKIVSGNIPNAAFTWSIDNRNLASIDPESGVLFPYNNGVVTVTATSVYNPGYSVSMEVTLSGQAGPHTLTYMPGTDDGSVSGLPSSEIGAGIIELSKTVPVRDGYVFIGWSAEKGKVDTIESVVLLRYDVEVYAVWAKGFSMEFNGDTGRITSTVNGSITASEDKLIVTTGANGDIRFSFEELNIDPDVYKTVQIRMAVEKNDRIQLFYKGEIEENGEKKLYGYDENGFADAETYSVERNHINEGLENWFVVDFNMYRDAPSAKASWQNGTADLIKNIWLDVTNVPNSVVYIDYIRFISEMPENAAEKVTSGRRDKDVDPFIYPMDVEDLTNPGTLFSINGKDPKIAAKPLNFKGITEEIIVNFDSNEDSGLFGGMRNAEIASIENSELTVKVAGSEASAAALETYDISLDADSHRYVIVKAKSLDLTANKLRMYFVDDGEYSVYRGANSKVVRLGEDYGMLIFDMSEFDKWNGAISRLLFSFVGKVEGSFKIDWVVFTNEIPSYMDDIKGVSEKFTTVNKNAMSFDDVDENEWFYADVARAYRLGLIEGFSEKAFNPYGNVTLAEAITVAVRLNRIYHGEAVLVPDGTEEAWYIPYVNEAIEKGIIRKTQYEDYTVPAARKEIAQIICKALPSSWYNAINVFNEIPDLDKSDKTYGSVIKLYKAGVVIGSDEEFNFLPDTNISRAELAAILGRCAIPDARKRVVTDTERDLLKIVFYAPEFIDTVSLESCTEYGFKLKDGFAYATSTESDPIVYLKNLVGEVDGRVYRRIRIGMKWDTEKVKNPLAVGCQIFFTTPEGLWSDTRKLAPKWDGKTDENGIGEFVFEFASNKQTQGIITDMRFDPFDIADAEFAIEYLIIE